MPAEAQGSVQRVHVAAASALKKNLGKRPNGDLFRLEIIHSIYQEEPRIVIVPSQCQIKCNYCLSSMNIKTRIPTYCRYISSSSTRAAPFVLLQPLPPASILSLSEHALADILTTHHHHLSRRRRVASTNKREEKNTKRNAALLPDPLPRLA